MNRFCNSILLLLMMLSVGSCIHNYPEGEGVDPTVSQIAVEMQFELDWATIETDGPRTGDRDKVPNSKTLAPLARRFIVVIMREGAIVDKREEIVYGTDASATHIRLPMIFTLHALKYEVKVWSDYVDPSTGEPLAYAAGQLTDIRELTPHGKDAQIEDCYAGHKIIDLVGKGGKAEPLKLIVPVEMKNPKGRLRLVATDYEQFLQLTAAERAKGETYSISVDYETVLPVSYSLLEDRMKRPAEKIGFSNPLPLSAPPLPAIGVDRMFVPAEGMTQTISVTVLNSAKVVVAQTKNITFPLQQGKITILKGDFLSNFISGGLSIDTEWSGEITIEIEI